MKRFISILFLFIFLISNIGVVFSIHYCGGKLHSVKLYSEADCRMESDISGSCEWKSNCCENKQIVVKNNQAFEYAFNDFVNFEKITFCKSIFLNGLLNLLFSLSSTSPNIFKRPSSPPLLLVHPLEYLPFIQVFRL
ncbi:MAG: hypothetical protein D6707_03395 [Bacteroidetes bacterium]|nr:MAG: hypothetical protein D6707_03395 [Bacteroidota bacterium]